MSKKTIILTREQLDRIVEGSSTYLPDADSNFREFGDNEVFATSKLEGGDGKPLTTDKLSKTLTRNNDSFGFTKQIVPTNYRTECKISKKEWEAKHSINESNSDLVNRTFNIGTTEAPEYISYTNLTTIISNLEKEKQQMGQSFPSEKEDKLIKLNHIYKTATNNSKNIRDSKVANGERVIKAHNKNYNNGAAHTKKNNSIIIYEN